MGPSRRLLVVVILVVMGWAASGCGRAAPGGGAPSGEAASTPVTPDIAVINASNPGQPFEFAPHLVKGKHTLFEYYSDRCEPSMQMARVMDYLAARRSDLAIRKVNIDRPGSSGIDFDSPLAQQHDIHAVPAFRVFSPEGALVAEGSAAKDMVRTWYAETQALERAPSSMTSPYAR